MNVTLAATAALLFGFGTYMLLQRKLSRIVIGLGILAHGGNVLFLASGSPRAPTVRRVGVAPATSRTRSPRRSSSPPS